MNFDTIQISKGSPIFGEFSRCAVSIENGIGRYRLLFRFGFSPSTSGAAIPEVMNGRYLVDSIYADVSVEFSPGQEKLLGQLSPHRDNPVLYLNSPRDYVMQLDLSSQELLLLVERTQHSGLSLILRMNFRFSAPFEASGIRPSHLKISHSDWITLLQQAELYRYEVITLRTPLRNLPAFVAYDECLTKLKEAQDAYDRGDWNGVGTKCRGGWNTLRSTSSDPKQAVEELLSSVTGDPRRKNFAAAVLKGLGDILNSATHLEGNLPQGTLPADLQREDAALCLHWYAMVIGYLAQVDPKASGR